MVRLFAKHLRGQYHYYDKIGKKEQNRIDKRLVDIAKAALKKYDFFDLREKFWSYLK